MLQGKKIVLGVTGSIAAYKAVELTREFIRKDASVRVIMTKNATEFITPLTFQTLSGNPVYIDMFSFLQEYHFAHISLAEYADIMVIAPATANVIGKIASGLADDLLTTAIMTTKSPVLVCPAMNTHMYENPVVRSNIARLAEIGYLVMEPGYGILACSAEGSGRLPEVSDIVEEVESILSEKDLTGEKILITAGPTREPFDPVRFITNYSSGKMGYALANAARRRGAEVALISGPTTLAVPPGIAFVSVASAVEMRNAVMERMEGATIIIKAAAVADYRPAIRSGSKIKKRQGTLTLSLERNPDIIAEIGKIKGRRILVGFAVETENLVENAMVKLVEKNMDLIVANDVTQVGAGFGHDTNIIRILDREGGQMELPMMEKTVAADRILDRIRELVTEKKFEK
jgi:phosphopantothenoylcysteine decarboxylase/phosphopantothenate--cysteine ligase